MSDPVKTDIEGIRVHVFRRWQRAERGFHWPRQYGLWHLIASTNGMAVQAVCGVVPSSPRGVQTSDTRPIEGRVCPKCSRHEDQANRPELEGGTNG